MVVQNTKMICPKCGAEMNHHADKLVDPVKPEDLKHVNPSLGGVVKEMHACPKCGAVESRLSD
jgi:ribosomal protein S27AE